MLMVYSHEQAGLPVRRSQRGFSMIEVLISLLVLSIGLLGLASLQVVGLQNNQSAYLRSQASILGADIVDSMRADRLAATRGNYNHASFDNPPSGGSSRAAEDLAAWWNNVNTLLPDGGGTVSVDENGNTTVRIRWLDDRVAEDGSGTTTTFVYRTEI